MRVRRFIGISALAVPVAVASIAAATASGATDKGPVLIGMSIAKTGGFSTYDLGVQTGVRLAIKDINAKGGVLGRQLKMADFNTASKLDQSGPGAKQLLSKGAKMIIGTSDYDFGGPASREAVKAGVFTMGFAGDTKFGYHGIGSLAFNAFMASPVTGAAVAEFAYSKGWRKAYTLTDTINSYPATVTKWFTDDFNSLGGAKVVGKDLFLNSDASVATQIARIKEAKPDVLLLSSFPPGGASALKQIRAAGIDIPVLGDVGFDGTYWYGSVPKLSNFYGVRMINQFGKDPNPAVNAFFKRYKAVTGKASVLGSYPAAGYSMVQLFARGATLAKSFDGKAIAKAVAGLKNYPTLLGKMNYAWRKDCNVPAAGKVPFYKVTNGKDAPAGAVTPKHTPPYAC